MTLFSFNWFLVIMLTLTSKMSLYTLAYVSRSSRFRGFWHYYLIHLHIMNTIFFLSLTQSAKLIGAGLATIGVVGAGAGIGIVFCGLLLAISRNPQKEPRLVQLTLLGFALCEAMGLLAIMMAFLILYS